jgi:isoleucyl-tRNA synthetase
LHPAGLQVQSDGNSAVVEALTEKGVLLKEEQYAHKYPYDWRTKKPTIFRATSQWFASVEGFRFVSGTGVSTAMAWGDVCRGCTAGVHSPQAARHLAKQMIEHGS